MTLRAMLADGTLRIGGTIAEVAARARRLVLADPRLVAELSSKAMPDPVEATDGQWQTFWTKRPLDHLAKTKKGGALFRLADTEFRPTFAIDAALGETFDAMVAELVDWRLAEVLLRSAPVALGAVRCKVSHASGKPIIFLDRRAHPGLPVGDTPVLINGEQLVARFMEVAVNVVHDPGSGVNRLTEVLRGWFGPAAGHPGTGHAVWLEPAGDGWLMRPQRMAEPGEAPREA